MEQCGLVCSLKSLRSCPSDSVSVALKVFSASECDLRHSHKLICFIYKFLDQVSIGLCLAVVWDTASGGDVSINVEDELRVTGGFV